MTINVIRFPKTKRDCVSRSERLAARRAYRKGIEQLTLNAIEEAFRQSAHIPGTQNILLKDAQLLFVASMRRAIVHAISWKK